MTEPMTSQVQAPHEGSSRLAFLLFLFLIFAFALTSSGRVRSTDEYMAFFQTESLVLRHSLAIPQAVLFQNLYGRFDRNQQPRAPYPAGQALAASPFYAAGMAAVALTNAHGETAMFLLEFAACMCNAVLSAATVAVLFLLLTNLGFSRKTSLHTALLIAFTTMLWPYSAYFFSEPLACLLLALAMLFLFSNSDLVSAQLPTRQVVIGGLLLGALVWVRFTHLLVALIACLALIAVEKHLRSATIVSVLVGCAVAATLAYNYHLYGNAFQFGYPDFAEGGRRLNSFTTPAYIGLYGMLFSPGKSILLYMPLVIPAFWGVRQLSARNRGLAIVAVVLPISTLLFFMTLTNWEGGRSTGSRYLLPSVMLLCLGVAPLLEAGSKRVQLGVKIAAAVGLFVQIVTIATSFLEADVGHGYYNSSYEYQLSYCQLTVQLQLFWKYLHGAPHQLGTGWDRWFAFLHDGGVAGWFITTLLIVQCTGVLLFGLRLWREYRQSEIRPA